MSKFKSILAATDGSTHGTCAVVTGAAIAKRASVSIDVITVVETPLLAMLVGKDGFESMCEDILGDRARREAEAQVREASASDVHIQVRSGFAAPVIAEVADQLDEGLIVVGAHPEPAIARFLVGSTAEQLIRLAHRPVLVTTEPRQLPYRRVLVGLDLSIYAQTVLETAAGMAETDGAALRALYVREPITPALMETGLFEAERWVRSASDQFDQLLAQASGDHGVVDGGIRDGHAGQEILREAEDYDADLVVVGTHGLGFFNRLLLGSTSTHLLRHAHRSLLVVPHVEAG